MASRRRKKFGDSRPAEWTPDWCPPPTFGTRRRPERKTYGPAMQRVAERLGTPMIPAQRYVADVSQEVNPDTGLLAYSSVTAELHRQFGKTMVVLLSNAVMRCTVWDDQQSVYTAQDRNHASIKFRQDFIKRLRRSDGFVEDVDFSVRTANGSEQLTFLQTGSTIVVAATEESSGHGLTLDLPMVDEAWKHSDTRVDSGFRTPMITRRQVHPGAQMWVVSAAGNQGSHYFAHKCERGRLATEADTGVGTAYFEWSCPEDWDIENPELWWYYIPALGHTITEADIAAEQDEMTESDWRRNYASQPQVDDEVEDPALDLRAWAEQALTRQAMDANPIVGRMVAGVAMSETRTHCWIGVAGRRADGNFHADLVESRPGSGWVVERLQRLLAERPQVVGVAVDSSGRANSLIGEMAEAGLPLERLSGSAYADACGLFADRLSERSVFHGGEAALNIAVSGAAAKDRGERYVWASIDGADVTPLKAVTLAVGALANLDPEDDDGETVYAGRGFFDVFGDD